MSLDASKPTPAGKRILVVDDHPIIREGLTGLIAQQPDLVVCGVAADARSTLIAVKELAPDLALVDVSLGHDSGFDLIKTLKAEHARLQVLVLSMHDELLFAERALRCGASGYVMKEEATERLLLAIRKVLAGGIHVSDAVSVRMLRSVQCGRRPGAPTALAELTDRELQVFRLLGTGLGTRQIADELHVSVKTVESHRFKIKVKLGLNTATELVVRAAQWVSHDTHQNPPDESGKPRS